MAKFEFGRAGIVAAALVFGTLCGITAPATAVAAGHRSCDAICAQARIHHPGRVATLLVPWKRYPYASQSDPAAIDRWGTVERQCTGYVTWALNRMGVDFGMRDRGKNGRNIAFLSAGSWAKAAHRGGWRVSHRPVVGSVAQWDANESSHWWIDHTRYGATAGSDGHVAIVTKVYRDGTVLLRQYNAGAPGRSYSTMRAKAPRYLYIGVR